MAISFTQQLASVGANLVRSWDFISEAQSFGTESFGDNVGIFDDGAARPLVDNDIKPPGTSGSLLMTIPPFSAANTSGQWFMNFGDPNGSVLYGAGDTFYINWWQRFESYFITHAYVGGGGWKQCIISAGDKVGCAPGSTGQCNGSCTPLELVPQNTIHRGFPQMYNSCSGCVGELPDYPGHPEFTPFEETFPYPGGTDLLLQNMMPAPYCNYDSAGSGYPGCFHYQPDEWMQFQVGVQIGPRRNDGFSNSIVNFWGAREGQEKQHLISWYAPQFQGDFNYMLCAGSEAIDQRYGKIWFTPYNTGKSAAEDTPTSYTWYGGLIVSTSFIPMSEADIGGTRLVMVTKS